MSSLHLRLGAPTPLDYFATLVASDEHFPLLEAAASLAQDENPLLDTQEVLATLDQMLVRLKQRIPVDASVRVRLGFLNRYFFNELGFAGNLNNYYDAENSYVSSVLRTRLGIPISVAVIWLELAQGLGLKSMGVGFPGHFLVKTACDQAHIVMDPLSGQSLSREDLAERLSHLGLYAEGTQPTERLLAQLLLPCSPRALVARMLHNLKEIHAAESDAPKLLAVLDRLIVLMPQAWGEYRDRGLVNVRCGDTEAAKRDLQTYVNHVHDAQDLQQVNQLIDSLN
jgi:regulator of sirC expression with transglutaminase-like and TPR domain